LEGARGTPVKKHWSKGWFINGVTALGWSILGSFNVFVFHVNNSVTMSDVIYGRSL